IASGERRSSAALTSWYPLPLPSSLSSTTLTALEPMSRPTRFLPREKNTAVSPYLRAFRAVAPARARLCFFTKVQYIPRLQFCKSVADTRRVGCGFAPIHDCVDAIRLLVGRATE